MKKNSGLTMLECMLSLVISLVLVVTLLELMAMTHHVLHKERQLYHIESKAQQFAYQLRYELFQVGKFHCNIKHKLNVSVIKFENSRLIFKYIKELNLKFYKSIAEDKIQIQGAGKLKKNDYIFINDCAHAQVEKILSVRKRRGQPIYTIQLNKKLKYKLQKRIYVSQWVTHQYFLKINSRKIQSLYFNNRRSYEWIEGVREFKVLIKKRWVDLTAMFGHQLINVSQHVKRVVI